MEFDARQGVREYQARERLVSLPLRLPFQRELASVYRGRNAFVSANVRWGATTSFSRQQETNVCPYMKSRPILKSFSTLLLPWSDTITGTTSFLHPMLPSNNIYYRIKAVQALDITFPAQKSSTPTSTKIICTASSDGRIHIYDLVRIPGSDSGGVEEIKPEVVYDSKGRG